MTSKLSLPWSKKLPNGIPLHKKTTFTFLVHNRSGASLTISWCSGDDPTLGSVPLQLKFDFQCDCSAATLVMQTLKAGSVVNSCTSDGFPVEKDSMIKMEIVRTEAYCEIRFPEVDFKQTYSQNNIDYNQVHFLYIDGFAVDVYDPQFQQ